jgi:23S rRNA (uridine2552-2'-O)-methyltransferase
MKKASAKGHGATRQLKTRIKRKSGLKPSSRRWLERHMNDPYVHRARAEGYRARSAFKLIEINDRFGILKSGMRVVDLGAAPGGWSQVAARITGSNDEKPLVVAIDYLPVDPIPGVIILEKDFLDEDAPDALVGALGANPELVMSDMAAPTTGHRQTDHLRTMHLCEVAADFAISVLNPGGHFLAKTFQGGTESALLAELKRNFTTVRHVKPDASREESVELYLLATGFKRDPESTG